MLFYDPIATVYTEEKWPIGTVRVERATKTTPAERWIFVKNAEASTAFAAGDLVVRSTTSQDYEGTLHVGNATPIAPSRCLGFAQHAIAAGSYGWIQCHGPGTVKADGTGLTTTIAFVAGDTNLDVSTMAAGEEHLILGFALAAVGANASGTAFIDLPSAIGG